MGDLISPIKATGEAEADDDGDANAADPPLGKPSRPARPARTPAATSALSGVSAFSAQMIGQSNRRRGLKAGAPMLQEAKSAYLEAEFSGPSDRRTRAGRVAKTDV